MEYLGADDGEDETDEVNGDVVWDLGHGESVNDRDDAESENGADNPLFVPG